MESKTNEGSALQPFLASFVLEVHPSHLQMPKWMEDRFVMTVLLHILGVYSQGRWL